MLDEGFESLPMQTVARLVAVVLTKLQRQGRNRRQKYGPQPILMQMDVKMMVRIRLIDFVAIDVTKESQRLQSHI